MTDADQSPGLPRVLEQSRDGEALTFRLRVSGDLDFLKDHFPSRPLVPGVMQLQWVFELAAELIPEHTSFVVKTVKFSRPMVPDREYSLIVERTGARVAFRYHDENAQYSSGVVDFNP